MNTIYGLTDPTTGKIRYIGVTTTDVELRLSRHIWDAKWSNTKRTDTKARAWFRSLQARPGIVILAHPEDRWAAERDWITFARWAGLDLVNTAPGGKGRQGPMSEESKRRMSASSKGKPKSPEHRAKIAAGLRGKKKPERTPEWRAAHAAKLRGRPRDAETKARIAEGQRRFRAENPERAAELGRYERTPEHRQRMSEALRRNRGQA